MMQFSDNIVRSIRTWVPIGVGIGLAWLARIVGIVIDEQSSVAVQTVATLIAQGVYHDLAVWLEKRIPAFGWLLGIPKSHTK